MSVFAMVTILILAAAAFVIFHMKHRHVTGLFAYEKKKFFFMPAERAFYNVLKLAVGDKYVVFGQVRVADLLRVKQSVKKGTRKALFNNIETKCVDYVLCDAAHLTVVAAVELDGIGQQHDQKTDGFLDQAFAEAGLPLVRFSVQRNYDLNKVEKQLQTHLKAKEIEKPILPAVNEETLPLVVEVDLQPLDEEITYEQDEQRCPKCAATMVLRKAEKGRRAGKYFLMCSTFPVCKRAMPVDTHTFEDEQSGNVKLMAG